MAAADASKIAEVRQKFEKKYNGSILDDTFDERDVSWVKTCDAFVANVLRAHKVGGNVDKAADFINDVLLFRAKMKLNDFKESDIHPELRQQEVFGYHGVDKDGRKIFLIRMARQKKGHLVDETKQAVAFYINQQYIGTPDRQILTLFDFTGAGITNIDMDVSQYIMVKCLGSYFPGVSYKNVCFKMPKPLEAVWMVIKGLMDPDSVKNTVFVSRKDIQTYVNQDQLPPHMLKDDKK